MEWRKINDHTYELYQAALPETGVESCTRFEFKSPCYIDVTFECIPRKDSYPYPYLCFFWASYIQHPKDPSIYFAGRRKGDEIEKWIKGETPEHGKLSTHRSAIDRRDYNHDDPFPLTLVFNESDYTYTRAAYFGRYKDPEQTNQKEHALMYLFDKRDLVRFTQSPSGGGENNPAWDFQWFVDKPKKDKLYRMSYRCVYKPWVSQHDLVDEYEKYRRGR
ncbi:hypothetical protein HYR69_06550 [Candidatus Sumerlaeota bacterium]|nr:hypothetical protein [Candidatus Sumerlaeota bacterium]